MDTEIAAFSNKIQYHTDKKAKAQKDTMVYPKSHIF